MDKNIEIKNISKSFKELKKFKYFSKKKEILRNINISLSIGDVFFLLGSNGSGKTTFLKLIAGLLNPDEGEINYFGSKNIRSINFGLSDSNFRSFYWRLTVRQNLEFFAKLSNLDKNFSKKRINYLLGDLDLQDLADKPFMNLSSGQMQSISICRALLNNPKVLLLDEPTTHLDPIKSKIVISFLKKYLIENNLIVIWCTHNIREVDLMATKIGYLSNGQIFEQKKASLSNPKNYIFEILKSKNLNEILQNFKFEIIDETEDCFIIRFLGELNFIELFQKFVQLKIDIKSIDIFSENNLFFNKKAGITND